MAKTKKKRNPQDATRAHDLAPVRRRVARLEKSLAVLTKMYVTHVTQLQKNVARLERLVG